MTNTKTNYFKQTLQIAKPHWFMLFAVITAIFLNSLVQQIPPLIQKALIDIITGDQASGWLSLNFNFWQLLIFSASLTVITTILSRIAWYYSAKFDIRFRFLLRQAAFHNLLHLSIPYYNQNHSSSLFSKVNRGTSQLSSAIKNISSNFIPNLLSAIIALIIVALVRWEIVLFIIIGFSLYILVRYSRFKALEKIEKKLNKIWDKEFAHFHEAISSIRLVKSFASENQEKKQFQKTYRKIINLSDKDQAIRNYHTLADILLNLWMWVIFGYTFYLGYTKTITVGTIILLVQYTRMIRQPLWNVEWTLWQIKIAQVGARDYFKILNAQNYIYQSNQPIIPAKLSGNIEFEDVSFTYPEKGGQHVFQKLNLRLKPGQTLAVVGKSGAGKTTLAHLLIRFFDPNSGNIYLDDHDLKELDLTFLRQNIGLVMQQSYLFADTIKENLRYAKPTATTKEIKIACKIANADEFIKKLPQGYNTKIGERGIKLSGGQQQRLSIARTILKNPPILILDEATSSLDSHSEKLVQEALEKLIKGRTTIIIAHRLSTIQKANKIIILGKKKILEQGTHQELVTKKRGVYASLHKIQSGDIQKLRSYDLTS